MIQKDAVLNALTVEAVLTHYQVPGRWFGRRFRSRRCPLKDHSSDAFSLGREGLWNCHACDAGGDLLGLVGGFEGLDTKTAFREVLEIAAQIAGVEDDDAEIAFDAPPPRKPGPPRPQLPPPEPLEVRTARAVKRMAWLAQRLQDAPRERAHYDYLLNERRIDPWRCRGELLYTPAIIPDSEIAAVEDADARDRMERARAALRSPAIVMPVRHIESGAIVDLRARRLAPPEGRPKIIGQIGGVTHEDRRLVGCYGRPHELGDNLDPFKTPIVIVTEGMFDTLAAMNATAGERSHKELVQTDAEKRAKLPAHAHPAYEMPTADVIGAVDAGSYELVAKLAADYASKNGAHVILVAQDDGPEGAAARAVDHALKVVVGILGPVGDRWTVVDCGAKGHKDLAAWHAVDPASVRAALAAPLARP
jgi:hypothetical protein